MTEHERRWVNFAIESAHVGKPARGTVPEHLFDSVSQAYDRLNIECAELSRKNKRLVEGATGRHIVALQRELRIAWTVAAVLGVAVGILLARSL
jgi:hypothetical protein